MTTPLPSYIATGTVRGKQIVVSGDTAVDVDTLPDAAYPVGALLTFTPSVPYLVFPDSTDHAIVYLNAITATVSATGDPVTTNGDVLELVANVDQPGNDQEWMWQVTVKIGATRYGPFGFNVTADFDNYLADQVPIPAASFFSEIARGPAGDPGPPGPAGAGLLSPETVASDGGVTTFDWGPTIRSMYSSNKRVDLTAGKTYYFSGTITVDAGRLISGSGGSNTGVTAAVSTLKALDSTAMLWVRGAGAQASNIMVDGNNLSTVCVKVGGTGTGDAGTSPMLTNVTAQQAGTGGKNIWFSGVQNATVLGCNSLNSGGEGWSFTDHCGGIALLRCESTGSASWNWHLTDSGNITLDTAILERSTNGTQASVRTDGSIFYPSLRLRGCTDSSGGVAVSPTQIATAAAISAAADTVTITGHGLFTGCPIQFSSITGAAGLTAGTTYYLISKTTNTFQVSTTVGGSAVNITSDGTANVSTVYRYLIDHQAVGTLILDDCNFGGITNEIAVGMRGGVAARLQTKGATYYTGSGLVAFLDYDSSAVVDLDGQVLGQVAGLTVGTVPLRTDRSPDTNIGRFRLAAETIWRSASTLLARASLAIGDTFARFQYLADGTMSWGSGSAAQDVTFYRSTAKTMTLQSAGGTTPVILKTIGDNYAARSIPLVQTLTLTANDTTAAGAFAIDASLGELVFIKLNGFNLTTIPVPSNLVVGQSVYLMFKQGSGGGSTVGVPGTSAGWDWQPNLDSSKPTINSGANAWTPMTVRITDNGRLVATSQTATTTGTLLAANNLSDVADTGTTRYNVHDPMLSSALAVATSNVASLSGTTTIDSQALAAGDQVLLTAQTTASQNGPWLVQSGAWTRPTDYPSGGSVKGRCIEVNAGNLYAGTLWVLRTTSTVTIDTTATTWAQANSGTYMPIGRTLDAVTAPAADVSLNSHKVTNLATGTAATDASTLGQMRANFDAISGTYAMPCNLVSTTTVALVAGSSGLASWAPIDLIPGRSYDALVGCVVTTAQSGGTTTTTLALYADKNGQPDVVAGPVASGTITLTATGNRVVVLGSPYTATAVRYWVGFLYVESVAPTTRATVSVINTGLSVAHDTTSIHTTVYRGWSATGLSAMPTGATTLTGAATPYNVAVRAA